MTEYVVRAGKTAEGPFSLVVTPESADWTYSSLRVLELPPGGSTTFGTGDDEMIVLPLSGGCRVECDGEYLPFLAHQIKERSQVSVSLAHERGFTLDPQAYSRPCTTCNELLKLELVKPQE